MRVFNDESTCPGETCVEDTQDRYDALAALEGVTQVVSVSRSYGLDRGAHSSAEVAARVRTPAQAREAGLAALRELDKWPDHAASSTVVTVRSDPPVTVGTTVRETEPLHPAFYARCPARGCRSAVADLRDRLVAELDGVAGLSVAVSGGRLEVRGRAEPDEAALAARAAARVVREVGVRVAATLLVEITSRAPLAVTLRLAGGLVCEQRPGVVTACDESNSIPFPQ